MKSLKGIKTFQADPMSAVLRVEYDPAFLSLQEIIRSVAETGLKARPDRKTPKGKDWRKDPRILSLGACGIFAAAGFAVEILGFALPGKIFYAFSVALGGYYPARMGLAALKTLTFNIRTLMVSGAVGAVALGLWEEAAILVFIYSLGDVLEAYAVDRARGALRALVELAPKEARVRRKGEELTLPVEEVKPGEILLIRPGEKIPLDGRVLSGVSAVDEASITGEPVPAIKEAGAEVFAGTVNQRGFLEAEATRRADDTTLTRIIHSVEEAQAKKSSFQRFGEVFGKTYTPAMFALSLGVTGIPVLFFGGLFADWFYRGLVVLVVSCSCGIALSIPVAVVAAVGNGARNGILFKGGVHLEGAAKVKIVAFDKTGTLTIGRPQVTDVVPLENRGRTELLSLAASLEARSEHPLGEAVVRKAREEEIPFAPAETFEALAGLGAFGKIRGREYFIGGVRLFEDRGVPVKPLQPLLSSLEEQGKTAMLLGSREKIAGVIAVADRLRPEAAEAVRRLREMGVERIVMLTGDNEGTARAFAKEAGVNEFYARLLPQDKVEKIRRLRKGSGRVAMVGDGINDAPAMAASDLGIAMGAAGTDIALETADIALMSDDLAKLPLAFDLGRRTVGNIRQNIALSLAVIAFLVPAALAGWIGLVPGLLINEIAGLAVIANGLRLARNPSGRRNSSR